MLSIYNVGGSQAAGQYYEKDDYYTQPKEGQRGPSLWQGEVANRLGLVGEVQIEEFKELIDGNLPNGQKIQVAAKGHLGGTDLTFSVPKSVSMQALIGGDERLIQAHDLAVKRSLEYAESLVRCRQTKDKKTERVFTKNMLAATFRHELSRACDPQLHTHSVILNLTQREDGQWRAMDNELLYRQKMLIGAMYRAELALEIEKLGYEIQRTREDGLFELAGFTEAQLEKFSERARVIEHVLAEKGKSREEVSAREKEVITLATRPKKTEVDRQKLWEYWQEKSREAQISYKRPKAPIFKERFFKKGLGKFSVGFALDHAFERQAVVRKDKIIRAALEHGVGQTTYEEIKKEFKKQEKTGELIRSGERYTTLKAQERERSILSMEKQGRGVAPVILEQGNIFLKLRERGLNKGQQDAAALILKSQDKIIGIQGLAGTGKTFMLNTAKELAEQEGYELRGLAPSAAATQELEKTGIKSQTLAAFEHTKDKQLNEKTLLVVDEAGMVSAKQMETVFRISQHYGNRVVLVGDTQQLKAVEAGRPFAQLQAHGMAIAGMGEIQRQKNPELKRAVELAAKGDIERSVAQMEKEIQEIKDPKERYQKIAKDYATIPEQMRDHTLILSGTHKARKEINERVREKLGLQGKGREVPILEPKDLTKTQVKQIGSYKPGDYVKPHRDYRSLKLNKNELCRVTEVKATYVLLETPNKRHIAWEPVRQSKFSVYKLEQRELTLGDKIRVTENNREYGLNNGDFAKVSQIEHDKIQLQKEGGKQLTLETDKPLNLEYGYCSTVHAAQGKTCEKVLMEADTHSLTSAKDNFYVALSRAQYEAKIYTDDKERLPQAMGRENVKEMALELNREQSQERSFEKSQLWPRLQATMRKEKTMSKEKGLDWELER